MVARHTTDAMVGRVSAALATSESAATAIGATVALIATQVLGLPTTLGAGSVAEVG